MKKIFLFIAIIALAVFSCKNNTSNQNAASLNYENLDVAGFKEKMDAGKVVILDVRTAEEFEEGHIKGAINFDVNKSSFTDKIIRMNEDIEYLVYCHSGRRSVKACNIMNNAGLKKLYNLEGGYVAWSKAQ